MSGSAIASPAGRVYGRMGLTVYENEVQLLEKKLMNHYSHPRDFPFWIQRNGHNSLDTPGWHIHEFVELIFVMEGQATHLIQDAAFDLRAGDVFMINPGEMHEYVLKDDQRIEIVNCLFQPDFIPSSLLREMQLSDSLDFFYVQPFLNGEARFHHKLNLQGAAAKEAMDLLEEIEREMRRRHPGFQPLIRLKMVELFILLSRHYNMRKDKPETRSPGELLVRRVCGYVERHYNQKITLALLSDLFHIGERQLNRQFNKYIGTSVIHYLHRIRIDHAKRLLADTDEKIAAIAELVGYEDPAFFTKLFTREANCPPGKYRETVRPSPNRQ